MVAVPGRAANDEGPDLAVLLEELGAFALPHGNRRAGAIPRSNVDAPAAAGLPQFRDPRTGQVWTPVDVGIVSGPNTSADRAFDPLAQAAIVQGTIVQRPQVTPLGVVPITAGSTIPLVTIEDASLAAIPEQRWQVVLHLNNNSTNTQ